MTRECLRKLLLCLFLGLAMTAVNASDLAKEKRWTDQVVDSLLDGEPAWLEAGDTSFLSIYTEAETGEGATGVLLIHGVGVHPNWAQVIYPLRTDLVEHGMATLSLQMPILVNDASIEEYAPLIAQAAARIAAGIRFLDHHGVTRVVVVAHSLGATMAANYVAADRPDIASLAVIGLQLRGDGSQLDSTAALSSIRVPMLDLYGSEDLERVLATAPARAAAASSNQHYQQQRVPGANHFFDDHDEELVQAVAAWIAAL